mgnify:CR=1 FL=1
MRTHVIGASGFLGKAIQRQAARRKDIIYYSSNSDESSNYNYFSLKEQNTWSALNINSNDTVILLSWRNLPNYNSDIHLHQSLNELISLFDFITSRPLKKIIIPGSCYEYGMQSGKLKEELPPSPVNNYAKAKNIFRTYTQVKSNKLGIQYVWLRIFFPYGPGQYFNSIIPSLERAIAKGEKSFDISNGKKIRDFLSIDYVAEIFLKVALHSKADGIFNVGSGTPTTISEFLNSYIDRTGSSIKLNSGVLPDRNDEPFSFWADCSKLKQQILDPIQSESI